MRTTARWVGVAVWAGMLGACGEAPPPTDPMPVVAVDAGGCGVVDFRFNTEHCGRCGNACDPGVLCRWGSCDPRPPLAPFQPCSMGPCDEPNVCHASVPGRPQVCLTRCAGREPGETCEVPPGTLARPVCQWSGRCELMCLVDAECPAGQRCAPYNGRRVCTP